MLVVYPSLYVVAVGHKVDSGASALWQLKYAGTNLSAARAEHYVQDGIATDPDLVLLLRWRWQDGVRLLSVGDKEQSRGRPVFDGEIPGESTLENVVGDAIDSYL